MSFELKLAESFLFGLLAPLTASCVLPLYPGFISFLSNHANKDTGKKENLLILGILVSIGVIFFMLILGLLFTTILQISLTKIVEIISPIAFILLAIVSILLIVGLDIGKKFKSLNTPTAKNPKLNALIYGFFFGAIIIPCNPGIIAVFFTRTVSTTGFAQNMLSFLAFAIGMALPLLIIALLSQRFSRPITKFLGKYNRLINIIAGLIMLIIALYYLIFIFHLFG